MTVSKRFCPPFQIHIVRFTYRIKTACIIVFLMMIIYCHLGSRSTFGVTELEGCVEKAFSLPQKTEEDFNEALKVYIFVIQQSTQLYNVEMIYSQLTRSNISFRFRCSPWCSSQGNGLKDKKLKVQTPAGPGPNLQAFDQFSEQCFQNKKNLFLALCNNTYHVNRVMLCFLLAEIQDSYRHPGSTDPYHVIVPDQEMPETSAQLLEQILCEHMRFPYDDLSC